jgi:hypothetical protein
MLHFPRWKIILIVGSCLLFVLLALRGEACGLFVLPLIRLADELHLSLSFGRREYVGLRTLARQRIGLLRLCARRGVSRFHANAITVARVPTNRLAPTARPRRLHPVRPNRPLGDNQSIPNGPCTNHAGDVPCNA